MKLNRLSHEKWLTVALSTTVLCILALLLTLTLSWQWKNLSIATLLFLVSYPLIWLAWRAYRFWCLSIMQLTTYAQVLKEGESSLNFTQQNNDNLLAELQREISALATTNHKNNEQQQTLDLILGKILDSWPVPVCLFDQQLNLRYRNTAMNKQLQQPMLLGSSAKELGFILVENNLSHNKFDKNWQNQTINYSFNDQKHWLFSALDISQPLHQEHNLTQNNLIRVLSHELRNSLSPMNSMTDTLLSNEVLEEQQTRLVLTRINQRSSRLLSFVDQYSQLTQLPKVTNNWFDLAKLIDECKVMVMGKCSIDFNGESQCYGDNEQLAQLLINLFKNSYEACQEGDCHICVSSYRFNQEQTIEINDNGPGFANLNNVLTPFYTTKKEGSGIGLALCAEIIANHGGKLSVKNNNDGHAVITLKWPIPANS